VDSVSISVSFTSYLLTGGEFHIDSYNILIIGLNLRDVADFGIG